MPNQTKKSSQPAHPDTPGAVYLVGAGPGDAKLITLAGVEALRRADVVVCDALANAALLDHAPANVTVIDAGKRAGDHTLSQDEINSAMAEHALAGRTVVRLKGGDPFIFGRGSEEAIYLHERGVPVVAIPGVTAAIAAPACAGVPITFRNLAATVTFVTGHHSKQPDSPTVDYAALARLVDRGGTLCIYMGMTRLADITAALIDHGLSGDTAAAVVQWGTLPRQRSVRSTLDQLPDDVTRAGLGAPAIIVIGPVAEVEHAALHWFDHRPLFGQTVVVTRTRTQSSRLRAELEALGAEVIESPTIEITPPDDPTPMREAVRQIADFDWVLLTSENAVNALADTLEAMELDSRHLAGVSIAAVGLSTDAALRDRLSITADFVPSQFNAQVMGRELTEKCDMTGKRVLYLKADIARKTLVEALTEAGATVETIDAYHTRIAAALPEALWEAAESGRIDWITFTSSSTARNFVQLAGDRLERFAHARIASIGPSTTATAERLGLSVDTQAEISDIDGLVTAIGRATSNA